MPLVLLFSLLLAVPAQAQSIDLLSLEASRQDSQGLSIDFDVRLSLSKAVEEALHRGVPLYFTAQANVYRGRWYWRDERVSRASRSWRVAYQPLTSSWRVSFGALSQSFPTQQAAMAMISRVSRWKIAEADQVDAGERYYLEFSYRLDSSQLPRPMQLDLAAQSDWRLAVERTLKID